MTASHARSIVVRWQPWSGIGLEHLVLTTEAGRTRVESVLISDDDPPFAARYEIGIDSRWQVTEAQAWIVGQEKSLRIRSVGEGRWIDDAGTALNDLDGAIDVDLMATPFTNTLPIRRLQLSLGESAEIRTAYFTFPELSLTSDPQRYTRIAANVYRFESLDSDFVCDIEVDSEGLVVNYPGLFRRVL